MHIRPVKAVTRLGRCASLRCAHCSSLCFGIRTQTCRTKPVRLHISLANPIRPDLRRYECVAVVDAGVYLRLPQQVADALALGSSGCRAITSADGSQAGVPYWGPVAVIFGDRTCFTGAVITGDHVALGSIAMQDMNLIVHPGTGQVIRRDQRGPVPNSADVAVHLFRPENGVVLDIPPLDPM